MKKLYCLFLACSLFSLLPLAAQDTQPSEGTSPLNKEEVNEVPVAQAEVVQYTLEEEMEEIDPEEKTKAGDPTAEKKTLCINVSPSEQKANSQTETKKPKAGSENEKVTKSPKCEKSKTKEAEASKKKPKASSRVKLVSYRPGLH